MEGLPIDVVRIIAGFSLEVGDTLRMCCTLWRDELPLPPLLVNGEEIEELTYECLYGRITFETIRGDLIATCLVWPLNGYSIVVAATKCARILRKNLLNMCVFRRNETVNPCIVDMIPTSYAIEIILSRDAKSANLVAMVGFGLHFGFLGPATTWIPSQRGNSVYTRVCATI